MKLSADLVRMVYICHPFANDPVGNTRAIRDICRQVVDAGDLPIAPQLYLPQFMSEEREREQAMDFCCAMLAVCDELRIYSAPSDGMKREIAFAEEMGVSCVRGITPFK